MFEKWIGPNARRRARRAYATLITTFPVARPDSEYASASRTCSRGNTLSTSGLIAPLSTSRVISLSCRHLKGQMTSTCALCPGAAAMFASQVIKGIPSASASAT